MKIFLLFFLISFNFACEQPIHCEEIVNKQPNFLKKPIKLSDPLFVGDMKILKHCGDFTDADSLLFKGPIFGTMMVKFFDQRESMTYLKIIALLQAIKNDSVYKNLLLTTALEKNNPKIIETRFEFKSLVSYENALAESKKEKKKLLLFFTGHACVNGVRMEEEVFIDPKVRNLLAENYLCFKAYVDEIAALPITEQYFSKTLKKQVKTIGERFMDLQLSKFKTDMQPYFAILDTNGKLIHQLTGGEDKQKFLYFLSRK